MANVCKTQIRVRSNPNTIDWLESELKSIGSYETDEGNLKFIDKFGVEGNTITDKIGTKWLTFDPTIIEREQTEEYCELFIEIETANTPPTILIGNLNKIVREKDYQLNPENPEVDTFGRYWDEGFQPIGVFSIYGDDTWSFDEVNLDVDMDDEWFWESQVEPAFDDLEA